MIDHDRKLIFIHVTRTGGTSIETALCGRDWWTIESNSKHISASRARALYGEKIWREYTTFSVVRNPFDRVISMWKTGWWHQKISPHNRDFKAFLQQLTPHPNEKYQTLFYTEILDEPLDYLFRFENLEQSLMGFFKDQKVDCSEFPHVQARERDHYRSYYDDETIALTSTLFANDLLSFDYQF